jgi:pSer/pThr/pTyr-binding forkhead associated (FHA) protein
MGHLRPVDDPAPIPAKRCPAGHPNNPDSERCRICDALFDPATEVEQTWPGSPARLLLEDGSAIDLVADLSIGRNPSGTVGGDTLAVTGPQVSRRHLVIEVDGWRVTVRDQGSTNGTFITRRGERGRRRVPEGESMPVRVGDTIHFGSRQALVVQSPTG